MKNTKRYYLKHCFYSVLIILLLISLISPLSAKADKKDDFLEMPLTKLVNVEVQSASRFKQKSSEAPSSVEVLTAEDIRTFNWRTLSDALNAIRGLHVRTDRNYTYLGVRGFGPVGEYNSRILIMINGRRMSDTLFDQSFLGEDFLLDMNIIDRIEYIPGSGSSVYGANALLGVINVITKKGKDINALRLTGEVGSLNTYRGRITYGKEWDNGASLLLNASQYTSQGNPHLSFEEYRDPGNGIDGIARNMDRERSSRLFGQLSYRGFTLNAGYVDRLKHAPTAPFGVIFNDKFSTVDRQIFVDLDYTKQIDNNLTLQLRGFHHWYHYHSVGIYLAEDNLSNTYRAFNKDLTVGRWWGGEFKLIGTHFKDHKWITGIDLQYDQRQYMTNFDYSPEYVLYNNSNSRGLRIGGYFQDEYRITNNLMLNAGFRVDHHHLIKNIQVNPRVGLIWNITPTLIGKLLYSSAFRAPNVFERDYVYLSANVNNPNNREELIKSYEAIAEWYPTDGTRFLGTVFFNDLKKLLIQKTEQYTNIDDPNLNNIMNAGYARSVGFELQGERRWDSGRLFKLSWTYNHTEMRNDFIDSGWSKAINSPQNLVKVHYAEPIFNNRFRLGFEEIFVDSRRTLAGNSAPSYHLFNINLAMTKPIYGFEAYLGLYNVLDSHPKMIGGPEHLQDFLRMDGRTVRFRLEKAF